MRRPHTLLIQVSAVLWLFEAAMGQDYRYAVFELPGLSKLDQTDAPGGIDAFGNVVGGSSLGPLQLRPTFWPHNGGVIDLGTTGGHYGGAASINGIGEVTGWAVFDPNGSYFDRRACLWRESQIVDLGTLGGETSWANALNDSVQVVGESEYSGGSGAKAFLWENDKMTVLPAPHPDWDGRAAFDINNLGEIVGYGRGLDGELTALLWRNGKVFDLGSLGGQGSTRAYGINESSVIVGSSVAPSGDRHAVKWVDGQILDIHTPSAGVESIARGLNDRGQIVGENNRANLAMVRNPGEEWIILNDVVPPNLVRDWTISYARSINDAGQIPVTASYDNDTWALLLTPVEPTMTLQGPQPGRAGEANGLRVTDCTPGARVTFLYSRFGGGQRIPGCDLQQNALQLDSPTVIGTAIANANGVATITRTVPPAARNQTILFQALVQNECAISQLVVHRFE